MSPGLFAPSHIAILVLVALLVFGPKRLPEIGRSLGRGIREFKETVTGLDHPASDDAAAETTIVESNPGDETTAASFRETAEKVNQLTV